mmetsp:Transcript_26652/g.55627  ORF Transcript_26652/g.55627 Transcript_26652/m.55627 type:complete len:87 (-) Transcript_26652:15-275(-)
MDLLTEWFMSFCTIPLNCLSTGSSLRLLTCARKASGLNVEDRRELDCPDFKGCESSGWRGEGRGPDPPGVNMQEVGEDDDLEVEDG